MQCHAMVLFLIHKMFVSLLGLWMLVYNVGDGCASKVLDLKAVLLLLACHWSPYVLHLGPYQLIS